MAIAFSTAAKNYDLSSGIKTLFDTNGVIEIRTGAAPGPNAAAAGTLLGTLTMAATSFGAPAAGVITAGAITGDSSADASGTAAHFRMRLSTESNTDATGTMKRIEGTVGTSGTDMIIDNAAIVFQGTINASSLTITHP